MEPQEETKNPVVRKLREWDAQAVAEVLEFRGETTVVVHREHLRRAAEYLARSIPKAEFVILDGVNHFAPLQRPDMFNSVVLEFLAAVSHQRN